MYTFQWKCFSSNAAWGKVLRRISGHFLFWLLFFGVLFIFTGKQAINSNFFLIDLPVTLVYTYGCTYLIIPIFLGKQRYLFMFLTLIVFSLMLSWFRLSNYNYFYYSMYAPELLNGPRALTFSMLLLNAKDFSFSLFIFLAVKYTLHWLKSERSRADAENTYLESELNMFKNQIDQHFLFNTLNNIYSLSVTEPQKTGIMVKKLWGLIDFIVNVSSYKMIELKRELELIADYVELEKLRYGDRLDFSMSADKSLDHFRIPPLLIFPLIENCFKHGSAVDPGNPWISIEIRDLGNRLSFRASNSLKIEKDMQDNDNNAFNLASRIKNVLEHHFPDRYKIDLDQKYYEFSFQMEILF